MEVISPDPTFTLDGEHAENGERNSYAATSGFFQLGTRRGGELGMELTKKIVVVR